MLVNNAGWDVFKPFTKTEPAQWDKLIAINLTGALHMHHAVLPGMAARKKGRIVNIASDAARVGSSGEAVYAACKGGLVAFSKTIAREHARHGITVNVVCPGPTDTALLRRLQGRRRQPREADGSLHALHPARPHRPARRPARRDPVLRQRRRRLRHRPGAQRVRRPDDERLTPATPTLGFDISSDAARVGSSGEAVYAACKGGLVAFSKTIAREHARHGITVNVVCPGPTDTALFADYKEGAGNPEKLMEAFTRSIPLGRIGQPDDLPGAVLFFASSDAAFVTGQVLSVSGGLTMNG